jgi:hypothetical protein
VGPARHCWVLVPVDGEGRRPGLLLEWRRDGRTWEGRVVYATLLRDRWAWIEEWLPAEFLGSEQETNERDDHSDVRRG